MIGFFDKRIRFYRHKMKYYKNEAKKWEDARNFYCTMYQDVYEHRNHLWKRLIKEETRTRKFLGKLNFYRKRLKGTIYAANKKG